MQGKIPDSIVPASHEGPSTDLPTLRLLDPLLAYWGKPHVTDDSPCLCGAGEEQGVVVHRRMPWETRDVHA